MPHTGLLEISISKAKVTQKRVGLSALNMVCMSLVGALLMVLVLGNLTPPLENSMVFCLLASASATTAVLMIWMVSPLPE